MEIFTQNEEDDILVEPLTQVENSLVEVDQANTNMNGSRHIDATEGPIQDGYGTERHGSQGDDELSADDVDTDEELLLPEDIVREYRDGQNEEIEPTPDTSMSDTLDVWREGLGKSGPPENLKNKEVTGPKQPVPAQPSTIRHLIRSREVCLRMLNAGIAAEVRRLTDIELKQCLEREIKNKKAYIDVRNMLPSSEIRIWTTDNRGAQIMRQVNGWMPGAFGGLQIQRKNSTVVVPKI
ncbi:MAG: hypothetical protein Q9205_005712 [Flavoplaca limonia]